MPTVQRADTVVLKMKGSWGASDIFNDRTIQCVQRVDEMSSGRLMAT